MKNVKKEKRRINSDVVNFQAKVNLIRLQLFVQSTKDSFQIHEITEMMRGRQQTRPRNTFQLASEYTFLRVYLL